MKYKLLKIFTKFLELFWNIIPLYYKAYLKEYKNYFGKMRYEGGYVLSFVDSINSYWRLSSFYKEKHIKDWVVNEFKEGDVFYDIGANVGSYSLISTKLMSGDIKVYAFEPSFSNFNNLCVNIKANNMNNSIIPFNILLANQKSSLLFNYSDITAGSAGHDLLPTKNNDNNLTFSQFMYAFDLDMVINDFNLPKPNHIKIDVDGNEVSVLMGMSNVLKSPELKTIQIEFDNSFSNENEIREILSSNQFTDYKKYFHKNKEVVDVLFKKF